MGRASNPPRGECRQCWRHAYDKSIHRRQNQQQDCAACVDHMRRGCPAELIVR